MPPQLLALLLGVAATGQVPEEEATPDPRLNGLTLTEALRLPRDQLRERVLSTGREGEKLVELVVNGYGMGAVFMSSPSAAAAGLCQAERRYVHWETTAAAPDLSVYGLRLQPPRPPGAPLKIDYEYVRQSFFVVEDRRAARGAAATQRHCARLDPNAPSFFAASAAEASRGVGILKELQRQLARDPRSVESRCDAEPDCFPLISALRMSEVNAVGACTRHTEPPPDGCRSFNIPVRSNFGFAEYIILEVEELEPPSPRRFRVDWTPMIMHFD
jgi:hypothetical protein